MEIFRKNSSKSKEIGYNGKRKNFVYASIYESCFEWFETVSAMEDKK
jgi:hypothetical protein